MSMSKVAREAYRLQREFFLSISEENENNTKNETLDDRERREAIVEIPECEENELKVEESVKNKEEEIKKNVKTHKLSGNEYKDKSDVYIYSLNQIEKPIQKLEKKESRIGSESDAKENLYPLESSRSSLCSEINILSKFNEKKIYQKHSSSKKFKKFELCDRFFFSNLFRIL